MKPAVDLTIPTPATATTEIFNFQSELGTVLEVLDSLINSLTIRRNSLQFSYNIVMAGIPGLNVPENLDLSDSAKEEL